MARDRKRSHHEIKLNLNETVQLFQRISYSDDNVLDVVSKKIECAFSKVDLDCLFGVIQFWTPVTLHGRRMLTACNQPFAYNHPANADYIPKYRSYKLLCESYRYNLDEQQVGNDDDDRDGYQKKMINGPPATAFLNHLPDLVMDMTCLKGSSPLLDAALDCELTCYFMLPVFYPQTSSTSPYCVGVVECSVEKFEFFTIFQQVKHALKSVGLSTFRVQQCWSYKSLPRLKHTALEVKEALEIICESHDLAAAQVWIPYENPNHAPFKSYLEGIQTNKQMFAVKFIGFCADSYADHLFSAVRDYYDTCDMLPLKVGQGLVGRTLETHKPHFCTNIFDRKANKGIWDNKLLGLISATIECSCLGICLRSIDTGNLDYAFEFLWPRNRNYLILMESLFLTLKRCLPSFKFASGSELGDELLVIDVQNSTGSGTGFFPILEGNRFSPIPKPLEEARRLVAEDCMSSLEERCKTSSIPLPREDFKQHGRSMNKPLWNLTGCKRPNFLKRKASDMYENYSESNEADIRANQDVLQIKSNEEDNGANQNFLRIKLNEEDNKANQELLHIKVEYADHVFEFDLPASLSTLMALKNQINKICELDPGTYKLKYLDNDEDWILMNSDEHLQHCIRSYRAVNGTRIRLLVLALAQ